MAKANLTASRVHTLPREHALQLCNTEPAEKLEGEELNGILQRLLELNDAQVLALVEGLGTPRLERYLLLTLHRIVRAPKAEPMTLELVDCWFRTVPTLLDVLELNPRQHELIEWADSAAEAYVRTN